MPRKKKSEVGSLDSLLDTMTNVVGILVILLAVTQLGVGEAVDRIADSESVDPEALEKVQAEAESARKEQEELAETVAALDTTDSKDLDREMLLVQRKIRDAQADVEALESNQAEKMADAQALVAAAQKKIEEQKKESQELEEELAAAEARLARLRAQLAETPNVEAPEAKIVHLPNPRPAPKDAQPLTFMCREGRVMSLELEPALERAAKRAAFVVQRFRLDRNPAQGIDGDELVKQFNANPIREDEFELTLAVRGRYPYVVFTRRANAGETAEQIERASSDYRTRIGRVKPEEYYLRYLVWPDSYEEYLVARQIASQRGLLAGWDPMTLSGPYQVRLPGKLRVGPPPPPKPKPKPGDPQPPKPKPKPPLPSDTID